MLFSLKSIFSRLPSSISISSRLYESQTCLSELELRWNISASSAKSMENKWRSWILSRLDPKKYLRRENMWLSSSQSILIRAMSFWQICNAVVLPILVDCLIQLICDPIFIFSMTKLKEHIREVWMCAVYCGSIIHMVGIQSILGALIINSTGDANIYLKEWRGPFSRLFLRDFIIIYPMRLAR